MLINSFHQDIGYGRVILDRTEWYYARRALAKRMGFTSHHPSSKVRYTPGYAALVNLQRTSLCTRFDEYLNKARLAGGIGCFARWNYEHTEDNGYHFTHRDESQLVVRRMRVYTTRIECEIGFGSACHDPCFVEHELIFEMPFKELGYRQEVVYQQALVWYALLVEAGLALSMLPNMQRQVVIEMVHHLYHNHGIKPDPE